MSREMITVLVIGPLAGWLAGFVVRSGGFGLVGDIGLGLGGSILATVVAQTLGIASEAGWFALAIVALAGATVAIGTQRRFWYAHA